MERQTELSISQFSSLAHTFKSPTKGPSQSPTSSSNPTKLPTSSIPTLIPTLCPSLCPSLNPTLDPSAYPTAVPTQPTRGPSFAPSLTSSWTPSFNPTYTAIPSLTYSPSLPSQTVTTYYYLNVVYLNSTHFFANQSANTSFSLFIANFTNFNISNSTYYAPLLTAPSSTSPTESPSDIVTYAPSIAPTKKHKPTSAPLSVHAASATSSSSFPAYGIALLVVGGALFIGGWVVFWYLRSGHTLATAAKVHLAEEKESMLEKGEKR